MTRKQSRLRAKQKFAEDEPHAAQLLDQLTSAFYFLILALPKKLTLSANATSQAISMGCPLPTARKHRILD